MLDAKICRVCLAANIQMYTINNTSLQETYEKLTGSPLQCTEGRPETVCFQCVARLRSCRRLQQLATSTNSLLTQLLGNEMMITESTLQKDANISNNILTVRVLENINIRSDNLSDGDEEVDVKTEEGVENIKKESVTEERLYIDEPCEDTQDTQHNSDSFKQESDAENDFKSLTIKREKKVKRKRNCDKETKDAGHNSEIDINECFESDNCKQESDSEDDLPLKSWSNDKHEETGRRTRRYKKATKLNAVEIILTPEQQMLELLERSKSFNYLNSPFKCEFCYKGFIHPHAYENHRLKHSESSGKMECSVCRMRYDSVRQLKAHAAAAHERRYACNRCTHQSHTKNQALDHEKWHNGYTYPCKLCGEKFSKPTSYLTHMRKSHASSHVCGECGRSFVSRHGLLMHSSKAHRAHEQKTDTSNVPPDKRYCKDCNIQFNSLDAWKRHVVTSVKHALWNDSSPECVVCEARVSVGARRAHMRGHARALRPPSPQLLLGVFTCEQCNSTFKTRSRLQDHVSRVHLGVKYNKNVVCEVCGKKCTSYATLRYHQRGHTGERPYVCSTCPSRFASSSKLALHSRTHSGERPYACAHCHRSFAQRPALVRHYRVHTGAKPYECQLCSKRFSQSNSLKLHVNTVHLKLVPNKKRTKISVDTVTQETV